MRVTCLFHVKHGTARGPDASVLFHVKQAAVNGRATAGRPPKRMILGGRERHPPKTSGTEEKTLSMVEFILVTATRVGH
jgi:hypothetical protein